MLVIIWKANEIRPLNIERAKQFQVSLIIWARYTECLWRNCLLKTRNVTKNVWLLNFFATQQFRSFGWLIFPSILLSKSWKLHKMLELISSLNFWIRIQLFRERSSEKVHATIPKGIVGGFEFTVLQRNLKEFARKAMKMCLRVLKESNKRRFDC